MSRQFRTLAFALFSFCLASIAVFTPRAQAIEVHGIVVGVSDGDTLTLLAGQERIRVRLSEIDAPEHGQPYGNVARQSLAELCFQRGATLVAAGKDRYGRTLGNVSCDGVSANREQVRRGLAWVYVRYARRDSGLFAVQAQAQSEHRGLWRIVEPEPPWEWRSRRRFGHHRGAREDRG